MRTRLQAVLQRAIEVAMEVVTMFTAKIIRIFDDYTQAVKIAHANDDVKEFVSKSASQEHVAENKERLVELASSDAASEIMKAFQTSFKLVSGIVAMNEIKPTAAGDIMEFYSKSVETVAQKKTDFESATFDAGKVLGHMCIVQSTFRSLEAGETRQSLIEKCRKSFQKKTYLKHDPHMWMVMDAEA